MQNRSSLKYKQKINLNEYNHKPPLRRFFIGEKMRLTKTIKEAIHAHAKAEYPNECCGLIIDGAYHRCTNIADDPAKHFEIDADDYVALESMGEIQAIVHSHPDGSAEPSEVDQTQMALHSVDWVICAFGYHAGGEEYSDVKRHKPKQYQIPLLGREYHHGLQDCYSLVRDYYSRELDIHLPDFARADDWWEDENHEPLYERNFEKAGFVKVDSLQKHDVILCRVGRTHHINHALIFLGNGNLSSEKTDAVVGDTIVIHHPHGRLSVREIYGDSWQKRTVLVVRHARFVLPKAQLLP